MSMLTGRIEAVIGVDTHKQQHTAALLDALGGQRGLITIVSDGGGYRQLLEWARRLEPGRRVWAVEGTGSFGAGLTSYLLEAGEWVCEVDRPDKPARKRGAKSDQIDAVRAARQALQEEHLAQPRRRGQREAIRVLKLGRQQAVDVHSQAVVQLKSLVVSAPQELRAQLRGLNAEQLVKTCARLRQNSRQSPEWTATVAAMHALARRRLDQYRRRVRLSGRGVRTFYDIDYSYEAENFHPLGLAIFRERIVFMRAPGAGSD